MSFPLWGTSPGQSARDVGLALKRPVYQVLALKFIGADYMLDKWLTPPRASGNRLTRWCQSLFLLEDV